MFVYSSSAIQHNLDDFELFMRCVGDYLAKLEDSEEE